jgi:hypothetical protein
MLTLGNKNKTNKLILAFFTLALEKVCSSAHPNDAIVQVEL